MIVVDASVLANVIGDDGDDGRRARQELRAADGVAAPDLVDVETVAVLIKMAELLVDLRQLGSLEMSSSGYRSRRPPGAAMSQLLALFQPAVLLRTAGAATASDEARSSSAD